MNKIMCLDVGTKRIGVALSDYLHIIATPCKLVLRKSDKQAIEEIKEICKLNNVNKIIVGLPYNMDGTTGFQAKNCIEFGSLLKDDFEIIYEDERLSSETARENLKMQNKKYTKEQGIVDIESACIILQEYLDRKGTK